MTNIREEDEGCGALQQAQNDGNIIFRKILSIPIPGSPATHDIYYVEILSSLGKTPCQYIPTTRSTCHLLKQGVSAGGKIWDLYLLNCPFGPPCLFLEDL